MKMHRAQAAVSLPGSLAVSLWLLVLGCYHVRSDLIATPTPPDDVFRCVQLELGRAGYAIVGADRASGWLHGQRRIERLVDVVRAEVYATVIPPDDDGVTHLLLTDNTHANDDTDRIRATCAPAATS